MQATIPSIRQSNLGPQQTPSRLAGAEREREREKSIFKSPEAFYRPMLTGQLPAAQGEGGGGCEGGRGVLEKLRMSERGQETREMATTTKMEM